MSSLTSPSFSSSISSSSGSSSSSSYSSSSSTSSSDDDSSKSSSSSLDPSTSSIHSQNKDLNRDDDDDYNGTSPTIPLQVPTVQPYVAKMERFELFSTAQCYYLIASDKAGTAFRVLKFDRTLIEIPNNEKNSHHYHQSSSSSSSQQQHQEQHGGKDGGGGGIPSPTNRNNHYYHNQQTNDNQDNLFYSTNNNSGNKQDQDTANSTATAGNASTMDGNNNPPSSSDIDDQQKQTTTTNFRPLSDFCTEDPIVYNATEIRNMLDMIHDGNKTNNNNHVNSNENNSGGDGSKQGKNGGLKPLVKAHGIVGFIRFLDCYLLTLITKKSKVGCLGGNDIYTIKSTETFPLKPAEGSNGGIDNGKDPHSVLLNMWNRGKRSLNLGLTTRELAELHYQGILQVVDLEKDFFFSYTYDITGSLQQNFLSMTSKSFPPPPFKDQYAWNYFQTRELEGITGTFSSYHWILPIINGAFIQRKLHDYGKVLNLTLLARRSRHFAGTRYLKRGVSDRGKVANDVEHEQIIHDETPGAEGVFSSYLQVRGSIPTYWTQESSVTMPKPPIVLNRVDLTYNATQLHFQDLIRRYGYPIIVADLVKQSEKREREVIIGNEYRHAIDYLNQNIDDEHKIRYCALDYSHISKHRNLNVSSSLHEVATWAVNQTGFFCSAPRWKILDGGEVVPFDDRGSKNSRKYKHHIQYHLGVPILPMEQQGVLRTNCIDCLDRTNVAQFSAGVESLGQQLVVMGIRNAPKLSSNSNIVKMLIDMYVEIGDQIALQYGGSEAHKKVQTSGINTESHSGAIGKHKELLTSIRRYYSNTFTDQLRQAGMNLFLGHYVPMQEKTPLWDMENDYYLHNFHLKSGRGSLQPMSQLEMITAAVSDTKNIYKFEKGNNESMRVSNLHHKTKTQNENLSVWWKMAIQAYIQQRMWMQLSHGHDSLLPARFERTYTPDKLSQFDKTFAKTWQKPMRISHSAQHFLKSSEEEKESLLTHRKKVHNDEDKKLGIVVHKDENNEEKIDDSSLSLHDYVNKYGYSSGEPYLSRYLEMGKSRPNSGSISISSRNHDKTPCEAYLTFVETNRRRSYSKRYDLDKISEFESHLSESNLASDDVDGVLKLSQSAHISNEILSGPFRGLSQHESAVEVTTAVQEQLNSLENLKARGALPNSVLTGVNADFKRRSLDTAGMMDAVYKGWNRYSKTEESFQEIFDSSSLGQRRSDLTDRKSMKLYCSFFDDSMSLTNYDMSNLSGGKEKLNKALPKDNYHGPGRKEESRRELLHLTKAKILGLAKKSDKFSSPALFPLQEQKTIPLGYEQINDDLYARKDNRFMVFNGVGVESSWPPIPKSKKKNSLISDIKITLSVEK